MSYNIIHDDASGNPAEQWNNIKVNKLTCSELFLSNGFDVGFYSGHGPNLQLRNLNTNTAIPTLNPITTFIQKFGNVITLRINTYIIAAGTTTPSTYELIFSQPIYSPTTTSSFICPYSHILGNAALDFITYKLTVETLVSLTLRLRNNGVGLNAEFFDNTDAIEFNATTITYILL